MVTLNNEDEEKQTNGNQLCLRRSILLQATVNFVTKHRDHVLIIILIVRFDNNYSNRRKEMIFYLIYHENFVKRTISVCIYNNF